MRILGIAAAAWALLSSAQAAVQTYDLTFFDHAGGVVGSGVMSYDPTAQEDIWLDTEGGTIPNSGIGPCTPGAAFCVLQATWTPVDVAFSLYGQSFVSQWPTYLQGSYGRVSKHDIGLLPDKWQIFDDNQGTNFTIWLLNGLPGSWTAHNFCFTDVSCNPEFGSITAILHAVPLPAAAWLFIAGVGAIGFSAQRKRAQ